METSDCAGQDPPPRIEESDDAVLEFVAANPGAIAYVAAETPTPSTVKVIEID